MVVVQCTHKFLYIIKQDINWEKVSISYYPLVLINLIYNKVLAQTGDQYPFAIVYKHELYLYGFQKNTLTIYQ